VEAELEQKLATLKGKDAEDVAKELKYVAFPGL
jgi:hypothetical protein